MPEPLTLPRARFLLAYNLTGRPACGTVLEETESWRAPGNLCWRRIDERCPSGDIFSVWIGIDWNLLDWQEEA